MEAFIRAFWARYCRLSLAEQATSPEPIIDSFGDSPELADQLLRLILHARKTATCSLLSDYERAGEAVPTVGQRSIVLDGRGRPTCVLETTEVVVQPFSAVGESFAYDEGEDDRSLASWNREHRKYFKRVQEAAGLRFDESMQLVCERFRLLYQENNDESFILLREMRAEDMDAIFAIRILAWDQPTTMEELAGLSITPDSVRQRLKTTHRGWVCTVGKGVDEEVVGFAVANRKTGELWVVGVLAEYRKRGLGSRLMRVAEDWLFSFGFERIWLNTYVDASRPAVDFYKGLGWKDCGVHGEDRKMVKRKQTTPR